MVRRYTFWVVAISLMIPQSLNARTFECDAVSALVSPLKAIYVFDWREVRPERLSEIWPFEVHGGGVADTPNIPCSGTSTVVHRRLVVEDACLCCQWFVFDRDRVGDSCDEHLTTITIFHAAKRKREAKAVVEILLRGLRDTHDITWMEVGEESATTALRPLRRIDGEEIVTGAISRNGKLWVARITVSRIATIPAGTD
jgi:hypothetical protein